jgi:hypothetical protein
MKEERDRIRSFHVSMLQFQVRPATFPSRFTYQECRTTGASVSFGIQVEILEPLALRAQVVTRAENVAAFYAKTLPNSGK